MKRTEILKKQLIRLAKEINAELGCGIKFNQQIVVKENMSFSGANGRIWVSPTQDEYDISLSGKSLEKEMYGFMKNLCGKQNDGFKQTKPEPHAPFWRVPDFELVRKAVYYYANTRK